MKRIHAANRIEIQFGTSQTDVSNWYTKSSQNNVDFLKRCRYFRKRHVGSLACLCCSWAGLHLLPHAYPSPNVLLWQLWLKKRPMKISGELLSSSTSSPVFNAPGLTVEIGAQPLSLSPSTPTHEILFLSFGRINHVTVCFTLLMKLM